MFNDERETEKMREKRERETKDSRIERKRTTQKDMKKRLKSICQEISGDVLQNV